jgi:hypothetical protein
MASPTRRAITSIAFACATLYGHKFSTRLGQMAYHVEGASRTWLLPFERLTQTGEREHSYDTGPWVVDGVSSAATVYNKTSQVVYSNFHNSVGRCCHTLCRVRKVCCVEAWRVADSFGQPCYN